jgi:spore coat protein U-like protein
MTMARTLFAVLALLLFGPSRGEAACQISTAGVAFGAYDVFNLSPVNSTGSINYRCGKAEATSGNIMITLGTGQSGTFAARSMRNGTEVLSYNLYLDAALTSVWGNGTGGTQFHTQFQPPFNTQVNLTVYGRVPAGQDVGAGMYTDTIVATINF